MNRLKVAKRIRVNARLPDNQDKFRDEITQEFTIELDCDVNTLDDTIERVNERIDEQMDKINGVKDAFDAMMEGAALMLDLVGQIEYTYVTKSGNTVHVVMDSP